MNILRIIFVALFSVALLIPAEAADVSRFVGELKLLPAGCESSGKCKLGGEFGFIDAKGDGWQAQSGLETDGASIPGWAQPIVGLPFDPTFIKAAVIHDHYCWRNVKPWRPTHRVFYEALRVSGVPAAKAKLMYYAVYLGGPKWTELIEGRPCPIGNSCTQNVSAYVLPSRANMSTRREEGRFVVRPPRYNDTDFSRHIDEAKQLIDQSNADIPLETLEKLASEKYPDDYFYGLRTDAVLVPGRAADGVVE